MSDPRDEPFTDYSPGEVPERLPEHIWAYWDACGEFMDSTTDRAKGEQWVANGAGYVRHYIWWRPGRVIHVQS